MIDENTKKQLLAELEKYGNVYATCLKAGIHRSTLYRWMEKNKRFKKEVEKIIWMGKSNMCDMAENSLLQNMKSGNQRAAEFVLTHNSPKYRRKETSNVVIVHKKDFIQEVREPNAHEVLAMYDRIFVEGRERIEAEAKQAEEERLRIQEENKKWSAEYISAQQSSEEKIEEIQLEEKPEPVPPPRKGPKPRNKEDRHYP